MSDRKGEWISTFSGGKFWPQDPRPEDVAIADIAHQLSMICRYGGACKRFYSVAEHSIYVSELVDPKYALVGLLHDAAEAYIGDIIRPLKHSKTMSEYRHMEAHVEESVWAAFDIDIDLTTFNAVKNVDNRIIVDETIALLQSPEMLTRHDLFWDPLAAHQGGFGIVVEGLLPENAEAAFLFRYAEILSERG